MHVVELKHDDHVLVAYCVVAVLTTRGIVAVSGLPVCSSVEPCHLSFSCCCFPTESKINRLESEKGELNDYYQ